MAEYIDRDKIINRICNEKCRTEYGKCQKGRDGNKVILCVCDFIRLQEVADVAPVVHAQWIEKDCITGKYFECSNCHKPENKHTAIKGKYCWYCGARMDGMEENG